MNVAYLFLNEFMKKKKITSAFSFPTILDTIPPDGIIIGTLHLREDYANKFTKSLFNN